MKKTEESKGCTKPEITCDHDGHTFLLTIRIPSKSLVEEPSNSVINQSDRRTSSNSNKSVKSNTSNQQNQATTTKRKLSGKQKSKKNSIESTKSKSFDLSELLSNPILNSLLAKIEESGRSKNVEEPQLPFSKPCIQSNTSVCLPFSNRNQYRFGRTSLDQQYCPIGYMPAPPPTPAPPNLTASSMFNSEPCGSTMGPPTPRSISSRICFQWNNTLTSTDCPVMPTQKVKVKKLANAQVQTIEPQQMNNLEKINLVTTIDPLMKISQEPIINQPLEQPSLADTPQQKKQSLIIEYPEPDQKPKSIPNESFPIIIDPIPPILYDDDCWCVSPCLCSDSDQVSEECPCGIKCQCTLPDGNGDSGIEDVEVPSQSASYLEENDCSDDDISPDVEVDNECCYEPDSGENDLEEPNDDECLCEPACDCTAEPTDLENSENTTHLIESFDTDDECTIIGSTGFSSEISIYIEQEITNQMFPDCETFSPDTDLYDNPDLNVPIGTPLAIPPEENEDNMILTSPPELPPPVSKSDKSTDPPPQPPPVSKSDKSTDPPTPTPPVSKTDSYTNPMTPISSVKKMNEEIQTEELPVIPCTTPPMLNTTPQDTTEYPEDDAPQNRAECSEDDDDDDDDEPYMEPEVIMIRPVNPRLKSPCPDHKRPLHQRPVPPVSCIPILPLCFPIPKNPTKCWKYPGCNN